MQSKPTSLYPSTIENRQLANAGSRGIFGKIGGFVRCLAIDDRR